MNMCDHCKENLPLAGDFVVCPLCSRKLHFDCTTVTERSWRSMGSKRDTWKCQFCRNASESVGITLLESSSRPLTPDMQSNKRNRSEIISPQKVDKLGGNISEAITNEILVELKNMKMEMKSISDFCNFVSQKFDDINKNIEKNNTVMDTLMNEIQKLKDAHHEKEEVISQMQAQINKLEQQQLKNTIEIKNISTTQNENLTEIVKAIGNTIKLEVASADIADIYRTRTKNTDRSSIVVTFNSNIIKTNFLKNARATRPLTIAKINQNINNNAKLKETKNNNNVFINNMLTGLNKQLLWQAKKKAREEGWRFVWESAGKVYVRREENVEALFIQSMTDINKIRRN